MYRLLDNITLGGESIPYTFDGKQRYLRSSFKIVLSENGASGYVPGDGSLEILVVNSVRIEAETQCAWYMDSADNTLFKSGADSIQLAQG